MPKTIKKVKHFYQIKQNIRAINFEELLNANKDKIEYYKNINTKQPDNAKMRQIFSIRCPQRLFPPIQIESEFYAVDPAEKSPDDFVSNANEGGIFRYKLHVRRGTRRLLLEINTPLARQIHKKMFELYKKQR